MQRIERFNDFIQALEMNELVAMKRDGSWHYQNAFEYILNLDGASYQNNLVVRAIRWLLGYEDTRLVTIAQVVCDCFYEMEKTKVRFENGRVSDKPADYKNLMRLHNATKRALENVRQTDSVVAALQMLALHDLSVNYRYEDEKEQVSSTEREKLIKVAKDWKSLQYYMNDRELTENDHRELSNLCQYPDVVSMLLNPKGSQHYISEFQDLIFDWIIRDENPADVLAQFPGQVLRIKRCYLAMRLENGKPQHEVLKLKKIETPEGDKALDLTVAVYNKDRRIVDVSILNDSTEVEFPGDRKMTIQHIFEDEFAKKQEKIGDLEVLRVGPNGEAAIALHNSHNWGFYDAQGKFHDNIDPNREDFYKHLPVSFTLSKEEAKKEFEKEFSLSAWHEEADKRFKEHPEWLSFLKTYSDFKGEENEWVELIQAAEKQFSSAYGDQKHPPSIKEAFQQFREINQNILKYIQTHQLKPDNPEWDKILAEAPSLPKTPELPREPRDELIGWLRWCKSYYAKVDGKKWIEFGAATRTNLKINQVEGAHGLKGWGIPNEDGSYKFIFAGKFASSFPNNWWEKLTFFCGSHHATEECPDTNLNYHHRQPVRFSEMVRDPEYVQFGLERLRWNMIFSRMGFLAFQYQTWGCAGSVQDDINAQRALEGLPPLKPFYMHNKKSFPPSIVNYLLWISRPFPDAIMRSILLWFFPWRGRLAVVNGKMEYVRYWNTKAWKEGHYNSPSGLHYRDMKEMERLRNGKPTKYLGLLPKHPEKLAWLVNVTHVPNTQFTRIRKVLPWMRAPITTPVA